MSASHPKRIAIAGLAAASLVLAGCGDDESESTESTESLPEISISVPLGTEATDTTATENGKGKEPGPPISKVPQPSAEQQARINECIAQAQNDPDKILECTKIANE